MLFYRTMKNIHLLLLTLGGSLLLIVGVTFLFSRQQQQVANISSAQLVQGARHFFTDSVVAATPSASPVATDEATASESATPTEQKITVVEFSDFQCPACQASYKLKNQIFAQFSPEEVEFVYRHFPLTSIHPNAVLAAEAAEAASKFDKFWQMHDKLFENQSAWSDMSNDEAKNTFITYAEEIDINKEEFQQTMESEEIRQAVQVDVNLSRELSLSSTPTFFVNDQKVSAPEVIPTIEQIRQQ